MRKRLFYRPLQARTPESAKKHFQGFFTDQRYFFRLLVLKQIGYPVILCTIFLPLLCRSGIRALKSRFRLYINSLLRTPFIVNYHTTNHISYRYLYIHISHTNF